MAKAKAKKATKLPKLPDGSVFKPEGARIATADSVAVAKPAKAKGISKPGGSSRDKTAMFNHLFDPKMGITAKKAPKNRVGKEVKPMHLDPMCVTLQKHGPEVRTMNKLDRLEEKDPVAFRKELNKWMRGNNVVKSAR